jgi:hypothetical protein
LDPELSVEAEKRNVWMKGNSSAVAFLDMLGYLSQIADDIADADTPKEKLADTMHDILSICLVELPLNTFYQDHQQFLHPILFTCLNQWGVSNRLAVAEDKNSRMFAFVLRESLDQLTAAAAFAVGGRDWAKYVTKDMHAFYHVTHAEGFAEWDAEEKL